MLLDIQSSNFEVQLGLGERLSPVLRPPFKQEVVSSSSNEVSKSHLFLLLTFLAISTAKKDGFISVEELFEK